MNDRYRVFNFYEKIACITLDFEPDYGDRTGEFNIIENQGELFELKALFDDLRIPITAFITTSTLSRYERSFDLVKRLASDFHCHSHTHKTKTPDRFREISDSASTFKRFFGYQPLGYRAPLGVLYENDTDIMRDCGFKFSTSVFPFYYPGKFCNLSVPATPFMYANGIIELPFATIPWVRYPISLSYLKFLGLTSHKLLSGIFGLPNVVVFDSHLHDYIISEKSFKKLSRRLRLAWRINGSSGKRYLKEFVECLRRKRYRFMTMTELYNLIEGRRQ